LISWFRRIRVGWEVEASGFLKTSKKIEAAKKLMDWHISPPRWR
jgi:ABC-type Fe3+ transport system substrate-binding protein